MNNVLLVLLGVSAGVYFAEPIRKVVPVLKPADADVPK